MKSFKQFLHEGGNKYTFADASDEEKARMARREAAEKKAREAKLGIDAETEAKQQKYDSFVKSGMDPDKARSRVYGSPAIKGTSSTGTQQTSTGTQQTSTGTQQTSTGTNKKPKINFGKVGNRLNLAANTYQSGQDLYTRTKERMDRGEKFAPAAAKSSAEVGGGWAGASAAGRAAAPYIAKNVRNFWVGLGLGTAASVAGYMGGSSATNRIIRRLEGSQANYSKFAQSRANKSSRANSASRNVYGASQGSAITGIGGNSFVTRRPSGAAFMSTGAGSQRRTVQLPSTQLVRDPRSGRQTVGDLAYRNGTPVYLSRASTASRDSNYTYGGIWRNLQRNLNFGGQRERDRAAAKREYRIALGNTQRYTRGLNISPQSAKRQKLPGY